MSAVAPSLFSRRPAGLSRERVNRWLVALTALWACAVVFGMVELWIYNLTPAPHGQAPLIWPRESRVTPDPNSATLVMLAHPKCPCTRASLQELASLMSDSGGTIHAHVLFVRPAGVPEGWEHSDTWRQAAAIPGVTVLTDSDGTEAKRFGAFVSGHTVVYDKEGNLLFQGGITKARGHAGGNVGRDRILSLVTSGSADRHEAPTFGCELSSNAKGGTDDGKSEDAQR